MIESSDVSRGSPALTRPLLWLFTIATGVAVANLCYNQPLLPLIAHTFGITGAQAGIVATLTQVGYAVGLLFLVPLGDMVERRRLVLATLVAVTGALAVVAAAPAFPVLCVASFAVGVTTIAPQLIVPLAAGMAGAEARGRVVGQVMAGLLVGALGGRVVAGFVGEVAGWRAMFALAAGVMLVLAAVLARLLPPSLPTATMGYPALLRSLWPLVREHPVVRDAALLGALFFAGFSAFWTTLAFWLNTPPLDYGSNVAGLFGLLGIAGALTAPLAGRLSDRVSPRNAIAVAAGVNALAWGIMYLGGTSLVGLAVGVVLLDAGTQAAQVSNQARVYSLPSHAHSRLNTIYMVSYFTGGAVGSVLGAAAWEAAGWTGVCGVGALTIAAACGVLALGRRD